jgi:hypothetical protein
MCMVYSSGYILFGRYLQNTSIVLPLFALRAATHTTLGAGIEQGEPPPLPPNNAMPSFGDTLSRAA